MKTNKYRFDDAYSNVYEWNHPAQAYVYCGSYYLFGIQKGMSYEKMAELVDIHNAHEYYTDYEYYND